MSQQQLKETLSNSSLSACNPANIDDAAAEAAEAAGFAAVSWTVLKLPRNINCASDLSNVSKYVKIRQNTSKYIKIPSFQEFVSLTFLDINGPNLTSRTMNPPG